MTRTHKRNVRKRLTKVVVITFISLIATVSAYATYQYKQGVSFADGGENVEDAEQVFNGEEVKFGKINVLLLGSDSRGEVNARTDTIMIAQYDQHTHQSKIISIMRDIYVTVPGHGKQKINAAYAFGGPELIRQTIKENFQLDVNYYAIVDFKGFSKIADVLAPNGIEMDIPFEMSYGIGMTIEPGKQILDGDGLLGYVRFRHDKLSDFGRVQRQQEVVEKLKDEALSISTILKVPKLLGVIDPYVDTNIDSGTLLMLGKDLILNHSEEVEKLRIPVDGSFTNQRYQNVGAVLEVDFEQNQSIINQFLSS